MKKTTKKTVKPAYIVDIVDAQNSADILAAHAVAKIEAGFGIDAQEFDALILAIRDTVVNKLFENTEVLIKLPNGNIIPGSIRREEAPQKKATFFGKVKNWFKK